MNTSELLIDFDDFKNSILTESNRIRADPTSYVPILKEYISYFTNNDNILYRPNATPIETYDGVKSYENAISFLKRQRPVNTLTYDERISKAAQEHANDLGILGLFTHDSKDGKNVSERIDKYCEWEVACCENIDLGGRTGVDVIVSLLVDDGLENKVHREHLFRPEFTHVGIGVSKHKDYETVVVIDYIGGIRDLGKPFYDKSTYKYEFPKEVTNSGFQSTNQKKELKIKSSYQLQDEDAPDGTTSMKIFKQMRLFDGKKNRVTKKYYSKEDGTYHVVEVEEL